MLCYELGHWWIGPVTEIYQGLSHQVREQVCILGIHGESLFLGHRGVVGCKFQEARSDGINHLVL